MSIYYFFSGFDKEKGFTPEIAQSLCENIAIRESFVFVASSPSDYIKTDLYMGVNVKWFRDIGISFKNVHVMDDRKTEAECVELIKNSSVIFLAGGTTLLQIEFLQKNRLIPLLKQFNGVIMGISAGAINMAVNSFYSADKDCARTHFYPGIGLADISIDPHFSIENRELLEKDILPFSESIDIYAMRDNSAIVVQDHERRYYGDIYLISKGKMRKIN